MKGSRFEPPQLHQEVGESRSALGCSAETLALKREITALARMTRETMAVIE